MTINDATITGIQGALASASGVLKVYDGHFSTEWGNSRSFYALYIAGEQDVVTGYIYGGTYSSPKYAIYIGNDNKGGDGGINADATTFVYGGTYNGGISAIYRAQQTATHMSQAAPSAKAKPPTTPRIRSSKDIWRRAASTMPPPARCRIPVFSQSRSTRNW